MLLLIYSPYFHIKSKEKNFVHLTFIVNHSLIILTIRMRKKKFNKGKDNDYEMET